MEPTVLNETSEEINSAFTQLRLLDDCFLTGFTRLTDSQKESLKSFSAIFADTPFQQPLAEAVDGLIQGNFQLDYFKTIAASRQSLQGSVYDSLISSAENAQGGTWLAPEELPQNTDPAPILDSCIEWLKELAINGFESLEYEQIQPFSQTLDNLVKMPEFYRQSSLLTGFINELSLSIPVSSMDSVPLRRWCDLWSKAVINSVCQIENNSEKTISGELFIIGSEVYQHSNCVMLKCHGIVKNNSEQRFVNFSITSFKVDTIVSFENWKLFENYPVLLRALTNNQSLTINEMPIVSDLNILWNDSKATAGSQYDLLETAKNELLNTSFYKVPSFDRHYIHVNIPFYSDNYKATIKDDICTLSIDGVEIEVDTDRISSMSVIAPKHIKASKECFGFMRFDNGKWFIQILAIKTIIKKKELVLHNASGCQIIPAELGIKHKKVDSYKILKERSSRLLRN